MKKRILLMVVILMILAINTYTDAKIPKIIDRIEKNKNPSPFDKIKVPLSEISKYELINKETFKTIKTNSDIGGLNANSGVALASIKFNNEIGNLPQIEQSVTSWTPLNSTVTMVVGSSNDYRGFYGLLSGVSGYYLSNDNGTTILREGALPAITGKTDDNGTTFTAISAGNPSLDIFRKDGTTYYASLYQDFTNTLSNAIVLGKSTPSALTNKTLGDTKVWQMKKIRADSGTSQQYNDRPWQDVDNSNSLYNGSILITWTVFNLTQQSSKIWMAMCSSSLSCIVIHNDLNPVSGSQTQTQNSKVSIDSAGRVIVTWSEYISSTNPPYYNINLWYRVFSPGGSNPMTNPILIKSLTKPVDGEYALQGNTISIQENAWSEVGLVGNTPRMLVVYQECNGAYLFDVPSAQTADSCSNSDTNLTVLDNYQTGNPSTSIIKLESSTNVHSFFPTLSINQFANTVDIAWYQSEYTYKHDYYLAIQQRNFSSLNIITQPTTTIFAGDPSAEVYFDGSIGDYFQIKTEPGNPKTGNPNKIFVHYTGNPNFALPIQLTDIYGFSFKLGGNQYDNILYTKTY